MKRLLTSSILLVLAACSSGETDDIEPTDLNRVASDGQAEALAKAIPAGDFLDLVLGGKIGGPESGDVEGAMRNQEGAFADIRSFVACPGGMDPCVPNEAPPGTVFTYVHVVYPGEDNQRDTGSGTGNDSSDIETADAFRLIRPRTALPDRRAIQRRRRSRQWARAAMW